MAQTVPQAGNRPDLGPIVVSPPQQKPVRRADPGTQRSRAPARIAGRPRPQTAVAIPATTGGRTTQTPLDTNVITEVGSRLGLTARQTPATVEVIDKQVIEDRGFRTTTDIAKAATGVTGGDAPGAPAIFSMRGFAGDQINTLYNDIWIGPSTMTGRPMDTANLERVEILKGPASSLSGYRCYRWSSQLCDQSSAYRADRQRSFGSDLILFKGYRAGLWLRRQHTSRRARLSLRHHSFKQCRFYRRYLFETQQCVGPA